MTNNMPVCDENLWSDENLTDPYPLYRRLRDMGSVVYLSRHDLYAVTRYDDVKRVMKEHEYFSSASGVGFNSEMNNAIAGSMQSSDPPKHTHYRKILERPLLPKEMRMVRETIKQLATEAVAAIKGRKEIEAVSELVTYIPVKLVSELVGLPPEGREQMLNWGDAAGNGMGPKEAGRVLEAVREIGEVQSYFADPTLPQRLRPGSWAARLADAVEAGELDWTEFGKLVQNYVLPSIDTTIYSTASLLWLLSTRPEVWTSLRGNPGLVNKAIIEAMRLEAPVIHFSKLVVKDADIGGTVIPAGKRIFFSYASANRDERHYPDPDVFDINRNATDHFAFGADAHACLGRGLATLEMSMLLTELADNIDSITLIDKTPAINNTFRGLSTLRLALG